MQITVDQFNVWYGKAHALKDINLVFPADQITAIVGPSGCGKSTLLKGLNRLLELNEEVRTSGEIRLGEMNIYDPAIDVTEVRTRIGLLAQKPFPLPMSIYDNVAYGPRIHGMQPPEGMDGLVQARLKDVLLWDEVKDRLKSPAVKLSVGQQQRLCLARALAVEPDALLADESTASLDPISAHGVEELLRSLRGRYTIIMVTHDLAQARRLADHLVFLWLGELVEEGPAAQLFEQPQHSLTQDYLSGVIS